MKKFSQLFNEVLDKTLDDFNPEKPMNSIEIFRDPKTWYVPNYGDFEEYDLADNIYAYAYKENQPDGNYSESFEFYNDAVEELSDELITKAIAFEFAIGRAGTGKSWDILDLHRIDKALPLRILATAKANVEAILKKKQPPVLMFTAKEPSRKKLYDALFKRADTNYEKLTWDNGPYREYILIDPKLYNEIRATVREIESDRKGAGDEEDF